MDTKFGGFDRRFTETSQVLKDDGKKVEDPKIVGGGTGVINWKTIEFWIGGANGFDVYKDRTNWRNINLGGIDFSQKPVSDKVVLIPEQTEFKIVNQIKYKDEDESVSGGPGGILDAIKTGVETFTGATARPEWVARSFDNLELFGLDNEYTFKFAYGKFGLFNAFEEVVKPILALTLFFGVEAIVEDKNGNSLSWDGHLLNSAASNIRNPAPTHAQFLAEKVLGAVGSLKGTNWDAEGSDLASTLARANSLIQSALASGAHNVATSSAYRNCYMSWGRFMFGPFTFGKTSYSFLFDY